MIVFFEKQLKWEMEAPKNNPKSLSFKWKAQERILVFSKKTFSPGLCPLVQASFGGHEGQKQQMFF